MTESRTFDLSIRLPKGKKILKAQLLTIAERNHITLNQLVTYIVEWFLDERKARTFTIKLK